MALSQFSYHDISKKDIRVIELLPFFFWEKNKLLCFRLDRGGLQQISLSVKSMFENIRCGPLFLCPLDI